MFMYSFFIEILFTIANSVIYAVRFVFAKVKEASPKIPKAVIDEIARALLPNILDYFASDRGKKEFEEWKKKMEEWDKLVELPGREYTMEGYEAWKKYCEENGYGYHYKRLVREGKDKTLCIVDFYGKNKALVAWRNNRTCKMGMTRICRVIEENGKTY